jgi:hypothetical protein
MQRQVQELSRLTRESLFFACAKKSNQKKAHPGGTPSALRAPGPQADRTFFGGTSMCRRKTARIVRAAPAGFSSDRLAVPHGTRYGKSHGQSTRNSQIKNHSASNSNSNSKTSSCLVARRRCISRDQSHS